MVFYDSACPLCRREINWYRSKLDASKVEWIDIHQQAAEVQACGLSCKQALRRIYVQLPGGQQDAGIAAFSHIWALLPAPFPVLAKVVRLWGVRHLLWALYECGAWVRFRCYRYHKS